MDAQSKLELLADAGRLDLACACSTKHPDEHRRRSEDGSRWLYPVSLPSGGRGLMLKTLLSSACANDCAYCPLRAGNDPGPRCTLEADELARLFLEYNRRHKLIGLFVSSGVLRGPDHTMDRLVAVAARLRRHYQYKGYLHLKIIPGASDAAIAEACSLASAVSVNIETPTAGHCADLSSAKRWESDILRPMRLIHRLGQERRPAVRGAKARRVRQTTQFIVGASTETDRDIVTRTAMLYRELRLERVYFSAYQQGLGSPRLPGERSGEAPADRLTREHRLYQTDFLLRQYKYPAEDIVYEANGRLSLEVDPKKRWADAHPEFYPVRAKSADREQLLRVPGLGPVTVKRILQARNGVSGLDQLRLPKARWSQARPYLAWE